MRRQASVAWQDVNSINHIFIKLALLLLAGLLWAPGPALAGAGAKAGVYVVGNDLGGYISNRLIRLRALRASGQHVEIRGNICYSTCTMFLGLPQTCVSPRTTFGFHGPSNFGRRLDPDQFEYFSRVIAQYYPAPLQSWYMATGRTRINRLYRIRGSEIIRMGVRAC